jgi:hypothetical protein
LGYGLCMVVAQREEAEKQLAREKKKRELLKSG